MNLSQINYDESLVLTQDRITSLWYSEEVALLLELANFREVQFKLMLFAQSFATDTAQSQLLDTVRRAITITR